MPVMMHMTWKGVTPEQYDEARRVVNWEGDAPRGGMFHVSAFGDGAMHITDVWETEEDFATFVQTRLTPGVEKVGITGEPQTTVYPVHALFTPAFERL